MSLFGKLNLIEANMRKTLCCANENWIEMETGCEYIVKLMGDYLTDFFKPKNPFDY